jgi:uncharacterized repeat protein (TIGR03806 family)
MDRGVARRLSRATAVVPVVAAVLSSACSAEPDAFLPATRALRVEGDSACNADGVVVSTLPCASWTVAPPFHASFRGTGAGLADKAGRSTGLTLALANGVSTGYVPAHLEVLPEQGQLSVVTTTGIADSAANTQDNALGVAIGLPNGIFRIAATLVAPPAGSGAYEQAGIWFGVGQSDYIKLVLLSAPDALGIQASLEQDDAQSTVLYGSLPALPETLRLSLEIDPTRREATAYARVGADPERRIGSFVDVPESWLGVAPLGPSGSPDVGATKQPLAGLVATHRNRAIALGPLDYRFADFDVTRRIALPMEPDVMGTGWGVTPSHPDVVFTSPTNLVEAPGAQALFITEREGRVYALPKAGGPKRLVLDLSATTQGFQDLGLLGIAFHPSFGDRSSPNGSYVYLHYAFADDPMPPPVTLEAPTESRLARFTVDLDTLIIDPGSELVLIAQQDEHVWHQGGAMFFGPDDGMLYLTVGDEGGALCVYDNCQRIDRDLYGGVLRLDVDQRGGAISHPIRRQPESGSTTGYFIPNDNPFVGEGVLEEFYAVGLRSPHRMTHDPVDGTTWIGDVGQNHREEIDVLQRAGNYQWAFFEGNLDRGLALSEQPLGVWMDPVLDLPREESNAVIGGVVYRGSAFPELYGRYIFGDHVYGNIWALDYEVLPGGGVRALALEKIVSGMLGRSGTITSFGTDADGELYVLAMGGSTPLYQLERTAPSAPVPEHLSEVGAFSNLDTLTPAGGLIPYDVQSPLFSDGAVKQRWLELPEAGSVGFAPDGPFTFPVGTVFVKHFELALDARQPDDRRRLETRLLVAAQGGWYGITYKWNADGSDAEPLFQSLLEPLTRVAADGTSSVQSYYYPSPSDCLVCHNADAGHVLGVRTAQLNGPALDAEGFPDPGLNQLVDWSERGLLDTPLDAADVAALPSLAPLSDASRTLEDRVRSYLDANCSMCHGENPNLRTRWDARYSTPLGSQGLIDGPLTGEAVLPAGTLVVTPGDPARSALWLRDGSNDPALRMPPLGRQSVDSDYLDVLEAWIESLN